MAPTLSYVIITPYTIAKSRTGGVIARLLSRTDLELVGTQIIAPDESFVREYAASLRDQERRNPSTAGELLATYVENNFNPSGGRKHRFLLFMFRGENACEKLTEITGAFFPKVRSSENIYGQTIRDTYGEYIVDYDDHHKIIYFEPAVLAPRRQDLSEENMAIFVRHFKNIDNIVRNLSYPDQSKIEQTLVILKPDNWKYSSSRPGNVIEMFSRTGLRIIATKVLRFSLNQAMQFYAPAETVLQEKLAPVLGHKAKEILEREFSLALSPKTEKYLSKYFGLEYAEEQFYQLLEFMSGRRPDTCRTLDEAEKPGDVKCMIIVYEGENAVQKIRNVLGPTDPLKAPQGTVRREFGSNIMINTAHASDSHESYEREKLIVKTEENSLVSIIREHLGR